LGWVWWWWESGQYIGVESVLILRIWGGLGIGGGFEELRWF